MATTTTRPVAWTMTQGDTGAAIHQLLREYLVMPGLSLTDAQLRRLLALDARACEGVMGLLAHTGYVVRRSDGRWVRPAGADVAAWRRAVETVLRGNNTTVPTSAPTHHRSQVVPGEILPDLDIDRILCPVDFSGHSFRALKYAMAIAHRYEASIIALHVVEPGGRTGALQDEDALEQLQQFVETTDHGPVYIESLVTRGPVVGRIVDHAKDLRTDLLVIGPGRRPDAERLPLESVTQSLLLSAPCPVLVIPRVCREATTAPAAFSRILCGVDFSTSSMQALRYATALASQFRGRLQVLHVMDLASQAGDTHALVPGMGTSWRELEAAAHNRLRAAIPSEVRETAIVDELVTVGSAAREIVYAAKDMDADLVVIGAQSRAGFDLLRFGSVAHAVVRDASCPVLVIRAAPGRGTPPTSRERDERADHSRALAVPA